MAPPLLFMEHRGSGGTYKVFRYVGGSVSQIGNSFASFFTSSNILARKGFNRVVQFLGDLYAVTLDGVYKLQPDGVTWSKSSGDGGLNFSNPESQVNTNAGSQSGLHVVYVGNIPYLTGVYKTNNGSNEWRGYWLDGSDLASGWTLGAIQTGPEGEGSNNIEVMTSEAVYRGVLHVTIHAWTGVEESEVLTWDVATDSVGSLSNDFNIQEIRNPGMCIFNDRLFAVTQRNPKLRLHEFTGGAWQFVKDLHPNVNDPISGSRGYTVATFTDSTNMYAIALDNSQTGTAPDARGIRAFQIDGSLTVTEITSTVLPSSLIAVEDGGSYSGTVDTRCHAIYDVDTNPGSLSIYIYIATDSTEGTIWTVYEWNGPGSQITQIDTGGDVIHALPIARLIGGERNFTSGELDVLILDKDEQLGAEDLIIVLTGDTTGPADKKFKLWYALEGEPNLLEATLSMVSGGSATFNPTDNQVEGLIADGATEYVVRWDTNADGLSPGDRVVRYPQAFL